MKEKRIHRSKVQKIILRPTYYLLHFSYNVVFTTNNRITIFFPFIVSYLKRKIKVVR